MAGPEHVGSGAFRVDRARALATLSSRRFQEPDVFVDCWLRCAEASGAHRVDFDPGSTCTIYFERPVPEAGGDPWAPVFNPSPKTRAAHELALGVLACLASKPKELSIETGDFRLEAESLEKARWVPRPKGARDTTTMRVAWGGAYPGWRARLKWERFWFDRVRFGEDQAPPKALNVTAELRRGHFRLRMLPRPPEAHRSIINVYKLGVFVQTIEADLPARAWIQVNDDAAELSIDLQRLSTGARRDRLLGFVKDHLDDLLRVVLRRHRSLFEEAAARLQEASAQNFWASRHGRAANGEELETAFSRLSPFGDLHRLVAAGWLADWLHACDPKGLQSTPLFFAGGGKTTTLQALREERAKEGVVRWSRRPGAAPVWCPTSSELTWLTRHFGAALREV